MVTAIFLGVVVVLLASALLYVHRSRHGTKVNKTGNDHEAKGVIRKGDRIPHDTSTLSILTAGAVGVGISEPSHNDADGSGGEQKVESGESDSSGYGGSQDVGNDSGDGVSDRWFGEGSASDSGPSDGSSGGGFFNGGPGFGGGLDGGGSF